MVKLRKTSIHLINLDRDQARLEHMTGALNALGLPFRRYPAVLGSELTPAQHDYARAPARAHLSAAEAGCLLSHVGVWRTIAAGHSEMSLVLEDDVLFAPDFANLLQTLDAGDTPPPGQIHRFETFLARATLDRQAMYSHAHRHGHVLHTNHAGAAAYLMSRETARHLLSFEPAFRHLPDTEMFDPDRRAASDLEIIQWLPAPCIQDMVAGHEKSLHSHLEADRSDDRTGARWRDRPPIRIAKDLFRPVYTRTYSLALAPSRRMRRPISFG